MINIFQRSGNVYA